MSEVDMKTEVNGVAPTKDLFAAVEVAGATEQVTVKAFGSTSAGKVITLWPTIISDGSVTTIYGSEAAGIAVADFIASL